MTAYSFADEWRKYWPWFVPLIWLGVYELYALIAKQQTLSEMVWEGMRRHPWTAPVEIVIAVVLFVHFFIRK